MSIVVSPKVEACLRITLASFFSYILSLAYLPTAIPPKMRSSISILGPILAFATPQLIFSIGTALLPLSMVILFAMVGATALLSAATISDGLFVAMFALWTLWCTGLWHGPNASVTGIFTHFCIAATAICALSPWLLVRNGFAVSQQLPLPQDSLAYQLLSDVCVDIGEAEECWTDISVDFPTEVIVPGDGNFAGQIAYISFENESGKASTVTAFILGGMWVVKGIWQWSGLTNVLAFNRNFIIVLLWSIACVLPSRVLPPVRTIRALMSQKQIPAAIGDAVDTIRDTFLNNDEVNPKDVEDSNGSSIEENSDNACTERSTESIPTGDDDTARRKRLVSAGSSFKDGGMAGMTAYEPRICRAPFECTWPILKELAVAVDAVVVAALASGLRANTMPWCDPSEWEESLSALEQCRCALAGNEDPSKLTFSTYYESVDDEETSKRACKSFVCVRLAKDSLRVEEATVAWLNAIHHPPSSCPCTIKNAKTAVMSYLPWVMPMLLFFKRLVSTLSLPFRPRRWSLPTLLHSLKFTLGFTVLVILDVYFVGYRNFSIDTGEETLLEPQLYSGWHLLAYVFATTPTCEGSFKKGLQRALGTVIGGFSAWLGLIVCSGSYHSEADANVYALVAWLTVSTAVASYFSVDSGMKAFMGPSPENGYAGMYYILTQSLIIMRVEVANSGTRNQIVVNRVVANLTGVAMAMIVAFIPPKVYGTDPEYTKAYFRCERDAVSKCMDLLLEINVDTSSGIRRIHTEIVNVGFTKQKEAQFLLKDASKMLRFPLFKVDPRLGQYLESLIVIATAILNLLAFAAHFAENKSLMADGDERLWFQGEIQKVLLNRASSSSRTSLPATAANVKFVPSEQLRLEVEDFVARSQLIEKRLDHYAVLLAETHRSSFY